MLSEPSPPVRTPGSPAAWDCMAAFHPAALSRFLVLYATLYAAFGVQSPYLPSLLDSRGLPSEAIALVLAAGTAIRLAAGPAAGRLADRLDAPRTVLIVSSAAAGLIALGYLPAGLMAAVDRRRYPFGGIGSACAAQRYAGSRQRSSCPTECFVRARLLLRLVAWRWLRCLHCWNGAV